MPKLPRSARIHPQPLQTGRTPAPLGWYVAGAALLALAATGGLVAFEAMRATPPAERAAEKTTAAPAPKAPEPPRVAAAPLPAAPPAGISEAPVPTAPPAPPPDIAASAPPSAPEPASPEPTATAEASPSPPLPEPAAPARARSLIEDPAAPTGCLPEGLRSVLVDLAEKFGEVRVVSTAELRTDNHTPGSVRAKIHEACRAVDIRTAASAAEVVAYLRTRREVLGVQSYRNGIIHFDASEGVVPSAGAPPAAAAPPAAPRPAVARPRGAAPQEPAAAASRVREAAPSHARAVARQRRARDDDPATTGSPGGSRARDIRPPVQRRAPPDDAPATPAVESVPTTSPFAPAERPGPER